MPGRIWSDTFKVAFTFAGTLIGAGFASGQELLQFFITYGSMGFLGIFFAGILFAGLGGRLLMISRNQQLKNCAGLMRYLCGRKTGSFFESAISCFLFTVLVIMLAAAGNVCHERFALSPTYGYGLLTASIIFAARRGIRSITHINSVTTPFLTLVIVIVSLSSLNYHNYSAEIFPIAAHYSAQPAPHWLISCILYVSYNLALATTVLVPLGSSIRSRTAIRLGSLFGGLLLAALSFLIVATILIHYPQILSVQIPMLMISCSQDPLHAALYTAVFAVALFTTSTACLYGCAAKLRTLLPIGNLPSLILTALAAACCTQIGFSRLIAVAFPIFGYLSLWIFIKVLLAENNTHP